MAQTVKAFQQHADNFLIALKTHLFDGKVKQIENYTRPYCLFTFVLVFKSSHVDKNTTDFAELFSMFVSSCEKVLGFANKR